MGDRGRRLRTFRRTRQRADGRPWAVTVSCNAITRARQNAVAEDLGMVRRWDLIAVPIGLSSRGLARGLWARGARPARGVVPAGMSGALQPSAPASSPPPRGATRSYRTARAERPALKRARARTTAGSGAAPGCGGCGESESIRLARAHLRRPASVRTQRTGTTIWYQKCPRTQHLAVGHALPCEGLSWHRTLDRTEAGLGG